MTGDRPRILFLHPSPGAQFEFLAPWLAAHGWDVTMAHRGDAPDRMLDGVRVVTFRALPTTIPQGDFRHILDYAAQTALGAAELFLRLRDGDGYRPDVVMSHVGWGTGLCARQVWPEARYVAYHEWFYTDRDWLAGRAEHPSDLAHLVANRMRTLPITAEFDQADANWCPTAFQASRFPPALRGMVEVVPDGVDCALCAPDPTARIDFPWLSLPEGTPVLTYATRGMEPLRGFPQALRAVERLQKRRPDLHTLVLGSDVVSYGAPLPPGETWRLRMLDSLDLDHRRLHVHPPRPRALQASDAHIYFTEPFVTSWSLSEALAAGCLVIGSDTGPVRELVADMETGILVDMDDPDEVADMVVWVLDHPDEAAAIRARARAMMLDRHDAAHVFPAKAARLRALIGR